MRRRDVLAAFISASVLPRPSVARAERSLAIIVPDLPGSAAGAAVRILQPYLEQSLARPVVLDFRPGAGGILGLTAGARAAADGATLTLLAPSLTLAPWLSRRMDCTPADFAPLGRISFAPVALAVRADAPWAGVPDLLARRAGHAEWAAPGPSDWDPSQVGQALFLARAGLSVRAVGGLSTPAARAEALLAGDVDLAFLPLEQVLDPAAATRLRVLGVTGPARVPQLPTAPSLREAGFDIPVGAWRMLAVPAGSPRPVVEQLGGTLKAIVEDPQVRAELADARLAPAWLGPAETGRTLDAEYREAGTLFAALGLSVRKQVLGLGSG